MYKKYTTEDCFYKCPRTFCNGTKCLPYGTSDDIGQSSLKMFCPCCHDVYHIPDSESENMDGAFFGPSWVHLFLAKYPDVMPKPPIRTYTPKIFGFKICPSSAVEFEEEEEESD